MNQGPADLQSAALATELCTHIVTCTSVKHIPCLDLTGRTAQKSTRVSRRSYYHAHEVFNLHFESCLGKPHYCHCSAAGHARLGMMLHTLMRSTPCGRDTPGTPALGQCHSGARMGGVDIEQSRLNKFNFNQRRLRWNAVASLILASPTLKLNKHQ